MNIFRIIGRLCLTTACPKCVQSIQEVGHFPQCSLKWERQTDLDFLLFIQPFLVLATHVSISVLSFLCPNIFYSRIWLLLFVCLIVLAVSLSPGCPQSLSSLSLKTYMKVALNGSDRFRQMQRFPTLPSSSGSDSLIYLKKKQPWCNLLQDFTLY